MAKILSLIYRVKDEGSKTLRKMKKDTSGFGGSIKAVIPLVAATGAAIGAMGVVAAKVFNKYTDYVDNVSDLNAMIGGTMEETSMLTKFMKDFDISMDAMSGTMMALARNGFDPSIDGLIALRNRLDEAGTEQERLTLAATLGGEQFVTKFLPAIEAMGDELDDYTESFDEALIVTEEMRDRQVELQKQTALLESEYDKVALTLGESYTPAIIDLLEWLNDPTWTKPVEIAWLTQLKLIPSAVYEASHEFWRLRGAIDDVTGAVEKYTSSQYYAMAAEALVAGDPVLAAYYAGLAENLGNVNAELERYIDLLKISSGEPRGERKGREGYVPRTTGGEGGERVFDTRPGEMGGWWYHNFETGYWSRTRNYHTGGSFDIGGGGSEQPVSFMGDPGEHVNISKEDSIGMLALELRRLVNTLPTVIKDVVERVL